MISVYSVLCSLVLFSELSGHSVTLAVPTNRLDDGRTEQESLGSLGNEALAEPAVRPPLYRQNFIVDNKLGDEDGNPQIIILSDMGLTIHSLRGLNPASSRSHPLLAESDYTPAEHGLKIERREDDLAMRRCMIGRVYRPCWRA